MWLTPHSISSPTLHVSLELNFLKDRNNIFFKVKFSLSQRTQKAKNEDNNPSSQRPGSVSFPRGNHPQRLVFVLSVVTFTPIYGGHLPQFLAAFICCEYEEFSSLALPLSKLLFMVSILVLLEIIHLNFLFILTYALSTTFCHDPLLIILHFQEL